MVFPACQIPILKGDSRFVYHDDVISETAGTNGPSVNPTRKRHRQKAQPLLTAGMHIVTADQASMQPGRRNRGFPLAMIMDEGIWVII